MTLATLKELKKHPELSRQDIRLFLAKLNQSGAITVLDFLNPEQAGQLCEKLMAEVIQMPCIKEGSTFKVYNTITGKTYGSVIKIINGETTILGKPLTVKPKSLIGKKEGSKITIGGKQYTIKNIQ